eukprot:jgi/Phyca11/560975/estExt2_Genewise1.C_PHYCAscaffold_51083
MTALHHACDYPNAPSQGDIWINSRASTGENVGWTALHIAASSGWQVGVTLLIAHGANKYGTTTVHLAAQNGHSSIVLTLLDAGADVNACDDFGDTPLLRALRHGRSRIVKLLLQTSKNLVTIDAVDEDGATPLWLAAVMGHLDVVTFLAQQGAN